jgi:hypothetical protein
VKQTEVALHDLKSREEEEATAPVRHLPQWTGIMPEMLPPAAMLTDNEAQSVLKSLTALLTACNCHVVFQTEVPERFQYEAIRQNFDQNIKVLEWNDGFFQFCKPNTPVATCALGQYCQCAFYAELFEGFEEEHLTPEEERARQLEFEVHYLKKKHGSDWMEYYPYHLDSTYDDEHGNPYNYGFDDNDEEKNDDWWKK